MPELRTSSHTDIKTANTIVSVAGEVDLATAERFRSEVVKAIEAVGASNRVVLDCDELDFMDSSGLQVLIQCFKASQRSGSYLLVASPTARLAQILHVAALDRRIPVHSTVTEALTAPIPDSSRRSHNGDA